MWSQELIEDSGVKEMLDDICAAEADVARAHMDGLAHQTVVSEPSARTERGTFFVTVAGAAVKPEGEMVSGAITIASGNPVLLDEADIRAAAVCARDAWIKGAEQYRLGVCQRAGSGAHILLTWRKPPEMRLWFEWCDGFSCRLAMYGRLAFEAIEDGRQECGDCAPAAQPDFAAITKALAQP